MLIRNAPDLRWSDITPERLYVSRREFIRTSSGAALGALAVGGIAASASAEPVPDQEPLPNVTKSPFSTDEKLNSFDDVTTYNNFYEFGTEKSDPAQYSGRFKPKPWTIKVDGLVGKPGDYALEDLIKPHALEERIYRHRCVEAWSMVIPWIGIPLGDMLKRFEPASKAKYVEFTTLYDPQQMPGQRRDVLDWPYVEGLRMDEAMHPLTLLVTGVYGKTLPNQNGAPVRLITPWKYGFKGIKSIVKIRFLEQQPRNTWNLSAPGEYGFYANVNPAVDHPRWSQKTERRLGKLWRQPTLPFNGYAADVASLYAGMDLRVNF